MLVPTVQTLVSTRDFIKSVIISWNKLYGYIPKKTSVGIIFSQHMIETGGRAFWNFNVANVKYAKSAGDVDYCSLKGVWEIVNGQRVELSPEDPGSWFRSFKTLDEGVEFYLNLIKNGRYSSAWPYIEAGDVGGFASALKSRGYFTADLQSYINGMNLFFVPFMSGKDYESVLSDMNLQNIQDQELKSTGDADELSKVVNMGGNVVIDQPNIVKENSMPKSSFQNILDFVMTIVKFLFPILKKK